MIEQLISLITSFWTQILPVAVVDEYQQAVVLRLGRFKKVLMPGPHFKIPFFDVLLTEGVVTDTYNLPAQALTTQDNKEIIVSAIVRYKISDVKKFTLTIQDEDSAIQDICLGAIRAALTSKTWQDCQDKKIDTYITNQVKSEVAVFGVDVEKVRLVDLSRVRCLRLFGAI